MTQATLVRVQTDILVMGSPATALWIVATGDHEEALNAVRAHVRPDWKIEVADWTVSEDTIKRLGLAPGQAWHL